MGVGVGVGVEVGTEVGVRVWGWWVGAGVGAGAGGGCRIGGVDGVGVGVGVGVGAGLGVGVRVSVVWVMSRWVPKRQPYSPDKALEACPPSSPDEVWLLDTPGAAGPSPFMRPPPPSPRVFDR